MEKYLINWKTTLAGVASVVLGVCSLLGVKLIGTQPIDPQASLAMIIGGFGLIVGKDAGVKAMIAFLAASLSLLAFAPDPARAGDVLAPAKASSIFGPSTPCNVATATTPLSCTGFYVGGGISGEGSNANIIGNGINGSVFAGGMVPTLAAGYLYAQGNWLFGAEVDVGYSIGTAGTNANVNGVRFTELGKVGGNLSGMLGTQTPITIPPALANAVIAPYVLLGQAQWQIVNKFAAGTVTGAGVLFDIGPQWFGDLRYEYTTFNNAGNAGLSLANDQSIKVTFNRKF